MADLSFTLRPYRPADEDTAVEITLADGRIVDRDAVRGVLNRMWTVPTQGFAGLSAADHTYAARELHAAMWSSLAALPAPVLNPPVVVGG